MSSQIKYLKFSSWFNSVNPGTLVTTTGVTLMALSLGALLATVSFHDPSVYSLDASELAVKILSRSDVIAITGSICAVGALFMGIGLYLSHKNQQKESPQIALPEASAEKIHKKKNQIAKIALITGAALSLVILSFVVTSVIYRKSVFGNIDDWYQHLDYEKGHNMYQWLHSFTIIRHQNSYLGMGFGSISLGLMVFGVINLVKNKKILQKSKDELIANENGNL